MNFFNGKILVGCGKVVPRSEKHELADSEHNYTETDLPELTAKDTLHLLMQGVSSFYVSNSLEKRQLGRMP